MTTPTDRKAAAMAPTESERLHYAAEMRYETRIRALEEEKAELEAQLAQRFAELGTLTRMMREKEDASTTRLADCRAHGEVREAELAARIAHLEQDLHSLRNSTSWRITRPLRWIARRLHRR